MKERVNLSDKLQSEILENMNSQEKQYEQQIQTLTKANQDHQAALKASQRLMSQKDMAIKFRLKTISELEAKLAKATKSSQVIQSTASASETNGPGCCDNCESL